MIRFLTVFFFVTAALAQEAPNAILLVAKPGLADPNFRETVVLVTQALDGSTVGVILNRPLARKHPKTGDPIYFGGPVMPEVLVAVFRSQRVPQASAFHVLKGVYITMHPQNIERLLEKPGRGYKLFAGFSGWAPGQLESELAREGWYVQPARADLVFRKDTTGMWEELVLKAKGPRVYSPHEEYFPRHGAHRAARRLGDGSCPGTG